MWSARDKMRSSGRRGWPGGTYGAAQDKEHTNKQGRAGQVVLGRAWAAQQDAATMIRNENAGTHDTVTSHRTHSSSSGTD